MKNKLKLISTILICISAIGFIFITFHLNRLIPDNPLIVGIIKVVVMLITSAAFLIGYFSRTIKFSKIYLVTFFLFFICCASGDFFLTWNSNLFFILGLSSYLSGHILLVAGIVKENINDLFDRFSITTIIIASLIATGLNLFFIQPNINGFIKIPVIIYSIAICIMVGGSASYLNHSERSLLFKIYFFAGTILFFISDAQLSLLLFYPPLMSMPDWLNGILFYPAVLLIAYSVLFEKES